jgi:hypothetical protein
MKCNTLLKYSYDLTIDAYLRLWIQKSLSYSFRIYVIIIYQAPTADRSAVCVVLYVGSGLTTS